MGVASETLDLFNKYGRGHFWRLIRHGKPRICLSRIPWKAMFDQTFMKFVCMVVGHDTYDINSRESLAPPDYVCKRCWRYITVPHKYLNHNDNSN